MIEVDASWNDLLSVPTSLSKLEKLTVLKLNNNDIKVLPNNIGELYLGANFNESIINTNISKLANLKELYLSQNRISKIPLAYNSLTKLETLDLSENKIEKADLKKLKNSLPNCEIYE